MFGFGGKDKMVVRRGTFHMETEQMWESKKAKQAADKMYEYFGIFLQSVLIFIIDSNERHLLWLTTC